MKPSFLLFVFIFVMTFTFTSCVRMEPDGPSPSGTASSGNYVDADGHLNGTYIITIDPGFMDLASAQMAGSGEPMQASGGGISGEVYCTPNGTGCSQQTKISGYIGTYGSATVSVHAGWVTGVSQ